MSPWLWLLAVTLWAGLMIVLINAGAAPITGTVAILGIVLLVANARALVQRRPRPLTYVGAAPAELVLGIASLTLALTLDSVGDGLVASLLVGVAAVAAIAALVALLLRAANT